VYGGFAIVSAVVAPSLSSSCRSSNTFARYCAFVVLHGVTVCAPNSSFSAINGVAQPVTCTAKFELALCLRGDRRRIAGAEGVPTRRLGAGRRRSSRRPPRAIAAGTTVPDETASTIPGLAVMGASCPA